MGHITITIVIKLVNFFVLRILKRNTKKGRQYNSSLFLPKNIYDDLWYDKVTANPRGSGLVEYTGAAAEAVYFNVTFCFGLTNKTSAVL